MWRGESPSGEALVQARGILLRERENSIFSDAWLPVAIIFLLIGLIANRNAALLALGIGLLVIVVVSSWWKRAALSGVRYERHFDRTHVFPGEKITMSFTITNHKLLPLTWLQISDELPVVPQEEDRFTIALGELSDSFLMQTTLSIGGFKNVSQELTLQFPSRGFYDIGPVRYQSGDVFTLFTIERQYRYIDTLIVYPMIWPLDSLLLPAKEIFGELQVRRSLFDDPVKTQGIRDYQPQDRFRDVHWKASARRGILQTKVYDPSSGMTIVTFLNVATFPKHWMGYEPDLLERAISVAASITNFAVTQKWGIGMYANGSIPGSDQPIRVPPGRSPEQLLQILEALAAVTEFATGSIELLMHRESPRLPWAATLVLVTTVVTEEMLVVLLNLKEAGRRVVLISLAENPPEYDLGDLPIYHIPTTAPAFQPDQLTRESTEAALSSVPVPTPAGLRTTDAMQEDGYSIAG
jgi:uncharacterized protein (DUF58 family)